MHKRFTKKNAANAVKYLLLLLGGAVSVSYTHLDVYKRQVQGMSGSPIIQDGKLIGAVTHVLISDPSRGYGITISSMLSAAEEAATMAIAA